MAIAAQNFAPLPVGAPSLSQGTTVQAAVTVEPFAAGTATITGDGATTAAVINWIDGVQALSFTPVAVLVFLAPGGSDTTGVLKVEGSTTSPQRVTSLGATSFTVNFSTAPANAATVKLLFI